MSTIAQINDHNVVSRVEPTTACPACHSERSECFYEVEGIPVNSCMLMHTREAALAYPRGDLRLAACRDCGFIWNTAFVPGLVRYSAEYEETQAFSDTFNRFHEALADTLIERHNLHDKRIIEIGCGKGEFLSLLCERGGNAGIGFDPGYRDSRNQSSARDRMEFITDFYCEQYAGYTGDFLCCKMTLEHIDGVHAFVHMVRTAVGDQDIVVFFQIPEMKIILRECRFWDIYYEHCSYFTAGSLSRLFCSCDFDVLNIDVAYDGQYLMIESRPAAGRGRLLRQPDVAPEEPADVLDWVATFKSGIDRKQRHWRKFLQSVERSGKRVAIWGSGSKAVAFLTTLGLDRHVDRVVDINPFKHGKFVPGTGHEIIAPSQLGERAPDIVVVMNSIYRDEVGRTLEQLGLHPELLTL